MPFVGILIHAVSRLVAIFLSLCLAGMLITMCSLVVTRYFFSYSPIWSEELTRYLMVWLTMLGGAILVLYEDHLAFTFLGSMLQGRLALLRRILVLLIVTGATATAGWLSWGFALNMDVVRAPGSGVSMILPTLSIPVGFTLAAVLALLRTLDLIARLFGHPNLFNIVPQSRLMDGGFALHDPDAVTGKDKP